MKVNDILHGFRLLKVQNIPEVHSTAFEFQHEKSGARLFYLQNMDDNKVFSITFRTPPQDDTGVAHIVEHSTLCGSRKYPLKEPFLELIKGSLNTFLNAMTFPDKTMYPVASRNDKDFQNLMDVYLDAVFYPAMYTTPEVLMQEGWHYEIEDAAEPLRYSGVVYNEMKGATSSPSDILQTEIMKSLYPDTPYSFESGGNPEKIPELTQEKFIAFHKRFYHPANSYIYLYGDMDIDAKLAFLDSEYLAHFDRITVDSEIGRQPQFQEMHRVVREYPVGADESTEAKTFLSLNMIEGDAQDTELSLALSILVHALLLSQAAPLRRALMDAKIGKDISSNYGTELCQPLLSIVVEGAEPDRADKFYEVVQTTLQKLVDEGIDRTLLEASINLSEFKLREADFGSYPKGLIYGISLMNSWLYDGDPAACLFYEQLLQKMKDGLQQGYFEKIVDRYLLHNSHKTLLTLCPSQTMAAAREKAAAALLAEKKAGLSEAEVQEIIRMTARLKERQQSGETPEALATIPILKLSDIRQKEDPLILSERVQDGMQVLYHDLVTNGIAYINLYFDASAVPQELLPYAYLLCDILGAVDTKQHSYEDLANLTNLHTGGISYNLLAYVKQGPQDVCLPRFRIRAKSLVKKLPQLLDLLAEILMDSSFADPKRLRELVLQSCNAMEMDLLRVPNQIMAARLRSYLSTTGRYNEGGALSFYWFVRDLADHFEARYEELCTAFGRIIPRLFNRQRCLVSVTVDGKGYEAFAGQLSCLTDRLSAETFSDAVYVWEAPAKNEGLLSSSRVQYVGKGADFRQLGYPFTGTMNVLESILRFEYLWTRIRVQGGAYGASASFTRSGLMMFGSYRDPNLKETLDVFDSVPEYLSGFDVSDREMDKFIIGTISGIDIPLTPSMKGNVADECWMRGISQEDRQRRRDEILATRQQDIRAMAPLVADCMKQNVFCVFGNEVKLQEHEELFGQLIKTTK